MLQIVNVLVAFDCISNVSHILTIAWVVCPTDWWQKSNVLHTDDSKKVKSDTILIAKCKCLLKEQSYLGPHCLLQSHLTWICRWYLVTISSQKVKRQKNWFFSSFQCGKWNFTRTILTICSPALKMDQYGTGMVLQWLSLWQAQVSLRRTHRSR